MEMICKKIICISQLLGIYKFNFLGHYTIIQIIHVWFCSSNKAVVACRGVSVFLTADGLFNGDMTSHYFPVRFNFHNSRLLNLGLRCNVISRYSSELPLLHLFLASSFHSPTSPSKDQS